MELHTNKTHKRRRIAECTSSAIKHRKLDQVLNVDDNRLQFTLPSMLSSEALSEPLLDTPEHELEASKDESDRIEYNSNPEFNLGDGKSQSGTFDDFLAQIETSNGDELQNLSPFQTLTPTFDDRFNLFNSESEALSTYPTMDRFHEENQDDQAVCEDNVDDIESGNQRVDLLDANAYAVRLRLASRQTVWSHLSAPLIARTTRQRSCEILMLKYVSRLPGDSRIRVWSNERGRIFYDCECGNRLGVQDLNKIKRHCTKLHQHHYKCPLCRSKFLDVLSYNKHILNDH